MEDMPIFWDMDGTLVRWKKASPDELFEDGFFLNGKPNENMVAAARMLAKTHISYIASKVLTEKSRKEKNEWVGTLSGNRKAKPLFYSV